MRLAFTAALALLALPSLAQDTRITPSQIGEIFCIARLGGDMAPVEGLLTADLAAAIADAQLKNDAIQKAHPDEKPPLGDGIPWQTFPDYADKCTAEAATGSDTEATVAIYYAFTDYPDANFTDSLVLKLVDNPPSGTKAWRIDNITYGTESDLRAVLLSTFDQ